MGLKADYIKTSPINVSSLSTMALSEELEKREGVESMRLEMEEKAVITVDGVDRVVEGPAILLINKD